jgi:hypothetical protein
MGVILMSIIFILISCSQALADRVLIRKSDGVPVEFQSGDAPLGSLEDNAVVAGYKKDEVEEMYISADEYEALKKEKIDLPKEEAKDEKKQQAIDQVKAKLKLSDDELEALKTALQ